MGMTEADLVAGQGKLSPKAQAYPSYWARLALANARGPGAAACAVNFPAWGRMCARVRDALGSTELYGSDAMSRDELAFLDFFAAPIPSLDQMVVSVLAEEKNTAYAELRGHVRLLQEYEVLFWDGVFEAR